jgi:transcriptional regulator with XRE-family HTH domain
MSWVLEELPTHEDVVAKAMKDPAYAAEHKRTELPHQISMLILRYREERALSLSAFARELGVSYATAARLEASEYDPSLRILARLASLMGVVFTLRIGPGTRRISIDALEVGHSNFAEAAYLTSSWTPSDAVRD